MTRFEINDMDLTSSVTVNEDQVSPSQRESLVLDELQVIIQQESTTYANRFDYISYNANNTNDTNHQRKKGVTESLRRKISEWSFEVVDHFGFDREVVSIALNYMDRVAAIRTMQDEVLDRKEFQLIAVAALYLAVKLHGEIDDHKNTNQRSKLEIKAFVELSRGLLSAEALQEKELEMLEMLKWQINPPTTVRIAATLLHLLPSWTTTSMATGSDDPHTAHATVISATYEMASYLTELSLCVSAISFQYRPSEIAYASLLCALEAVEKKVYIPYRVRHTFTTKVTAATNLTPQGVAPVRAFLRNLQQLHPDMFSAFSFDATSSSSEYRPQDDETNAANDRNISPVCVVPNNQCPTTSPQKHIWQPNI